MVKNRLLTVLTLVLIHIIILLLFIGILFQQMFVIFNGFKLES